jgi:beta-glucosidase
VEGWLLGQAGGGAIADVLYGDVNPSGRLAETIPVRLEDTPAYLNFPGEDGHVRYGEGVFVGYRWYDARDMKVAFPFGHGLSYTTFEYGEPAVETADADGNGDITLRVTVTNTGTLAGREVVQVYAMHLASRREGARELVGFASIELEAGESREVTIAVRRDDLSSWDVQADRFVVEGGEYRFQVGASSRDIRGGVTVRIAGDEATVPLTMDSTIGEVLRHPVASALVQQAMATLVGGPDAPGLDENMMKMMASFPIGRVAGFPGVDITKEQIAQLIAAANSQARPDRYRSTAS